MANKEILFGHDARIKIKKGIDKACDAVRPTLGPVGMTAIIEWPGLDPIECDDGVTILKNLEFKDHYENMGLQKLRKAAVRTSTEGGDGTATTTVLTQALVQEAFKEIANDSSKIREVRERLEWGLKDTFKELSKIKRDVTDDDIERIANISSLDPEVAKMIAEIIKEVGVHGVVTVEKGSSIGYQKEVVKGARFDKGLISQYFINDFENGRCVLDNPYIVLVDRKISMADHVTSIMNSISDSGHKSVLIIADEVDGIALASLIQASKSVSIVGPNGQQKQGTYDIACVRNPFTASASRDFLKDMAALTGGTVISEEAGMRLDLATIEQCGRAEKVIVTRDNATIIGGQNKNALFSRIAEIEKLISETTSEYTKGQLEDRLAQLTGGIGVIRVGAYTDTEYNAKKYKFENAINATQAALQEGILPGGGTALLDASLNTTDPIFKHALIAPFSQMARNAGMGDMEGWKFLANYKGTGINFKTKERGIDMFSAGIIDPFKVVRLALESAVAITSSLISVETAIVVEEDLKDTE